MNSWMARPFTSAGGQSCELAAWVGAPILDRSGAELTLATLAGMAGLSVALSLKAPGSASPIS